MSKLPDPEIYHGKIALYSARQLRTAFEDGRRAMLDEVIKLAPDAMVVLLKAVDEREKK